MDASSLKPGQSLDASGSSKGIFNTATVMVSRPKEGFRSPKQSFSVEIENSGESTLGHSHENKGCHSTNHEAESADPHVNDKLSDIGKNSQNSETEHNRPECLTGKTHKLKRKGDLEFDMQLEMALSATAIEDQKNKKDPCEKILNADSENFSSPSKRMKRIISNETSTSSQGISTAVGSMKVGSPLYWAEVYCSGENLTGKWVHIDALNLIIDGEHKVEAMVAACKTSLRYVIAFAGQGAKDVTRRFSILSYCNQCDYNNHFAIVRL